MSGVSARIDRFLLLPSGAVTDCVVVVYACWTIGANAVVLAGGSTHHLLWAGAIAFGLTIALLSALYTQPTWLKPYLLDLEHGVPLPPRTPSRAALATTLVAPLATLLAWLLTRNPWVAWIGIAASATLCMLQSQREHPSLEHDAPVAAAHYTDRERAALYVLAFACALFTLLAVRPRADDTFYLNMAASVVDYPNQALLSLKNLHGPVSDTLGVQKMFPPYRVHSFEVLGGLIGYLTGVEAARVVHLWLATAFAWMTPFALARLLRLLAPRTWLIALVTVVAFYMIDGSASRGYANHAFVRLFNGKAVLLTVAVPLLCAYGLAYGARPSRWRLALLALAQVSALGLSSTGLWLAPTVAVVSVMAGTPTTRALPRRLLAGLLSSGYVIGMGLWVMSQLGPGVTDPGELEAASDSVEQAAQAPTVSPRFAEIAEAIPIVLGPERTAIVCVAIALVAGPVAQSWLGLRLFSLLALVLSLGFANPFFAKLVGHHITGISTYQRVFWLLLVPAGLGVVCGACHAWLVQRFSIAGSTAVLVAGVSAIFVIATDKLVISEANQAKLTFPPALKLWPHARAVAVATCKWTPNGAHVLASQAVSLQLPILDSCGYPLATFDRWLTAPEQEREQRNQLVSLVGDEVDIALERAPWFLDSLARHHIDTVVLAREAAHNVRLKSLLRLSDFERVADVDLEQVFIHTRASRRAEYEELARAVCRKARGGHSVLAPFGVAQALERRNCGRVLTAPGRLRRTSPQELDELMALERVTFMKVPMSEAAENDFAAALDRRAIDVIVVWPQAKNRHLAALLARLRFQVIKKLNRSSILLRSAADPQ